MIARVLAVDPGGTTGMALWEKTVGGESIQFFQVPDSQALFVIRDELLHGLTGLVCESFRISGATLKKSTQGSLDTIEMIGVIRWLSQEVGCPFVLQTPGDAMNFSTDEKLKKLGWWATGQEHARSATRHLVLYLARTGEIEPARFV